MAQRSCSRTYGGGAAYGRGDIEQFNSRNGVSAYGRGGGLEQFNSRRPACNGVPAYGRGGGLEQFNPRCGPHCDGACAYGRGGGLEHPCRTTRVGSRKVAP